MAIKRSLLTDLDIIENGPLSINALINKSLSGGYAMHSFQGKIYSDEEVTRLPSISRDHPYCNEWKIREHSTKRLLKLVQQTGLSPDILEVGCSNGWLAAKLARITSGAVTGMDTNMQELLQARRVFAGFTNLEFVAADISDGILPDKQFDIIVFAASIQKLSPLKVVIKNAMERLTLMGQIHILDSPLCRGKNIPAAQQNTDHHYFHHLSELESFQYKLIYDPGAWNNKLFAKRDPFCHIVIKNHYH